MPTPYNTGKVKIGGAYVPRMKPEISHGMTGPHKRSFFEKPDRPVMLTALVAVIAMLLIVGLSGCAEPLTNDEIIAETKKCRAADMDAGHIVDGWTMHTVRVVCRAPRS